ncbi:MlaD family protein [Pseudohaliea rubra]|uniref:Paraquat-inducible protein B n=1 Tax=Pseudohaliea rubra DSM 19751 TaxID=1265313 RepID=A0A095VVA6_9GAMM|nr:MlaD family protein [Pseudohaliea rubra]KGE05295.1 Paraquat-inducible protein B [Pseudohaliea rubra DSM 19751]
MDERKHSVLIGAFVVGAAVVAIGAALFFGGAGFTGQRDKVVMVFDGSVKGLNVGAPIALRGVTVGQVTDIQLVLSTERPEIKMIVEAELVANNLLVQGQKLGRGAMLDYLVGNGLRAQLNMQSVLTGLLYIQLDFHPESPVTAAAIDSPYGQIPTIPTELEILRRTLQSVDYAAMAEAGQSIVTSLRTFVEDEDFLALPGELRGTLASLARAGSRLDDSLATLQPELSRTLGSVGDAAAGVDKALPALNAELTAALVSLDEALRATRDAIGGLGRQVADDSPTLQQLGATLREMSRASRSLEGLLQTLEDQPDALLRGRREK